MCQYAYRKKNRDGINHWFCNMEDKPVELIEAMKHAIDGIGSCIAQRYCGQKMQWIIHERACSICKYFG